MPNQQAHPVPHEENEAPNCSPDETPNCSPDETPNRAPYEVSKVRRGRSPSLSYPFSSNPRPPALSPPSVQRREVTSSALLLVQPRHHMFVAKRFPMLARTSTTPTTRVMQRSRESWSQTTTPRLASHQTINTPTNTPTKSTTTTTTTAQSTRRSTALSIAAAPTTTGAWSSTTMFSPLMMFLETPQVIAEASQMVLKKRERKRSSLLRGREITKEK